LRREALVDALVPLVADAYATLAGRSTPLAVSYLRSWSGPGLEVALSGGRAADVRRGVTQLGPHRDDVELTLDGFATRLEVSQGEQRTLALALRLAGHRLVTERLGEPPLLLLDDVLSELDPDRARALLANLPSGQTVITSAAGVPPAAAPDHVLELAASR
jgi:DNA replication and repair protein RecF